MIPDLESNGRLPVGRHVATLEEINKLFVTSAPCEESRARIFQALGIYLGLVDELIPSFVCWVDGGFVTHKPEPPSDVDVAILVPNAVINGLSESDEARFASLLTIQEAIGRNGFFAGSFGRVQPMGGLVDSYLVPTDDERYVSEWDQTWQLVSDPTTKELIPGERKGYLEVAR